MEKSTLLNSSKDEKTGNKKKSHELILGVK